MSNAFSRKLDEPRLMEHFLKIVLEEKDIKDSTIAKLTKLEKQLSKLNMDATTINNKKLRNIHYRTDDKRKSLRQQIINELYNYKRLSDDDKLKLTKGGSKPKSGIKNKKQAFIIIGLPAAGKSTIANKIAEMSGSYILDNDYAKRKLPEFHTSEIGASVVHNESELIVFGHNNVKDFVNFLPLFFKCVQAENNIVIPKIGSNLESLKEFALLLKEVCQYNVHLILVNLNRQVATKRALLRYTKSKRYVPLSLIFDGYANDPALTYFRLREETSIFDSYGEIDTTLKERTITGKKNSIVYKLKF